MRRADFVATLANALGIAPGVDKRLHGIDIEVTESLLLDGAEEHIVKLKAIREFGVGIGLDDFGTGYSSLGYLARLPVESLKNKPLLHPRDVGRSQCDDLGLDHHHVRALDEAQGHRRGR